jgi:hypothetical protein
MDLSLLKLIDADEISTIFEKAALFGGKIAQPTLTSNLVTPIKRIDVSSGTVRIRLFEEAQFENNRPISIKLNYRNLNFNIDPKEYSISDNTIITNIPTEARALEVRPEERYILPYTSKIATALHRIEKRGGSPDLECAIVDVCRKGLGLLISDTTEDAVLLKNDHVWIRSINQVKLSQPIFGRIVYASPRVYKDHQTDLKIGISLDAEIPEEVFSELQQMCKLILKA